MGSSIPCLPDTPNVPVRLYGQGNELHAALDLSADTGNGAEIRDDGLWVPGGADAVVVSAADEITTGTVNDSLLFEPARVNLTLTNPSATLDAYAEAMVWARNLTFFLGPGQEVVYTLQSLVNDAGSWANMNFLRVQHLGIAVPNVDNRRYFNPMIFGGWGPYYLAPGASVLVSFALHRYAHSTQVDGAPAITAVDVGSQLVAIGRVLTTPRDIIG